MFDCFVVCWLWVFYFVVVLVLLVGMWQVLLVVLLEVKQLDSFCIFYIYVFSVWMSLFVFVLMVLYVVIVLIWWIKVCEILVMVCVLMGVGFILIILLIGSIWGKGIWGIWWDWDLCMISELVLLFLYLGVIGLYYVIEDCCSVVCVVGLLVIVGVSLLLVICYLVDWWGGLYQCQLINVFGELVISSVMIVLLWWMVIGIKFWFVGLVLVKVCVDNFDCEVGKVWVGGCVDVVCVFWEVQL